MSCWPGRGNEFQLFTTQSAAAAALRKVIEPVVQIRLTACIRVRLEKLVKKFPEFMEPECSWRCSQQPVSFLHSQTDPAHAIPFDFLRSIFNVTLSITCSFSKRSVLFRFPVKNKYAFVSSLQACHMACLSNIWRGTEVMKLLIMQFILDSARLNGDCVKKGSVCWPTWMLRTSPPCPIFLRRQTSPCPIRVTSK